MKINRRKKRRNASTLIKGTMIQIGELILPKKDIKYIKESIHQYDYNEVILEVATYGGDRFMTRENRDIYLSLIQSLTVTIIQI